MTLRQRKHPDRATPRPQNVVAMARARSTGSEPPEHLEVPERELWASLRESFVLDDDASLAVLLSGLEARGRARRLRILIDEQGEIITGERGSKPNPLLQHERGSQALFLSAMKQLNLDG